MFGGFPPPHPPLRHPWLLNFPFSPILSLSLRHPHPIRFFPLRLSLFHQPPSPHPLPPSFSFNENCGGSTSCSPSPSLFLCLPLSVSTSHPLSLRFAPSPSPYGWLFLSSGCTGGEQRMWMGWVSPRLGERSITCEPKGEEIRGCAAYLQE